MFFALIESFAGYSLLLCLIIDRLHQDGRELHGLRKNMESVTKLHKVLEEAKRKHLDEINGRDGEIKSLTEQIEQMKLKQLNTAEANAVALRKQTDGLVFEYDRLLKENLNLQKQLQTIEQHCSHSDSKKNL